MGSLGEQQPQTAPVKSLVGNDSERVNVCRPLRYCEVSKAVRTLVNTLRDDPASRYLFDTPDADKSEPTPPRRWRAVNYILALDAIRRNEAWTMGGGEAIVEFRSASNSHSYLWKTIDWVFRAVRARIFRYLWTSNSNEQTKRAREWQNKTTAAIESTFAHRLDDMLSLDMLATSIAKQGRGYGSALVEVVTTQADAQRRATWLRSSNIANTAFYERFGFRIVKEIPLGDNNPTWGKAPVVTYLMVREPKSLGVD
ncbi:hypothetical protein AcW1_000429 [Taiwanofungus camphoratus]|nr:hypothetical protein AcW2_001074 [Antrodia cinnamomea]KAI0961316.1 hypothetical protein AcV7_000449 [Antrodia cinnamomea]KAI0963323.1 hypothetical protein AcW1_000429 [Antrodia cinnamomea]